MSHEPRIQELFDDLQTSGHHPFPLPLGILLEEKDGKALHTSACVRCREERHPEGRYFLEWYQGGKRRRHSVGGFENVVDGARRKAIELGAIKAGLIRPQAEPL